MPLVSRVVGFFSSLGTNDERHERLRKYNTKSHARKNEEDYFFDAFLSIVKNKIQIETSKAKAQVQL